MTDPIEYFVDSDAVAEFLSMTRREVTPHPSGSHYRVSMFWYQARYLQVPSERGSSRYSWH